MADSLYESLGLLLFWREWLLDIACRVLASLCEWLDDVSFLPLGLQVEAQPTLHHISCYLIMESEAAWLRCMTTVVCRVSLCESRMLTRP